ncbi:MAG TPA: winged helix DNA-binding domain-containing protein [Candidatus Limnocylindrales bacterium]|nr:winged helix DNA-binding domain-containing protein [Candidatus Limnocylindrales bacterium]
MIETTWAQIAALRLRRQHLEAPAPREAFLDVIRDHVGIQAQVMSSAELSLGARVAGLERIDVGRALWEQRTLVKTWAMRGTLHLVAAAELPELVAALGTRLNWLKPVWLRYFGVTADQMRRLQDAIGEVLTDRPMTRTDLAAALAAQLGDPAFAGKVTGSWGTFLKPAAARGLLCFGPDEGRNVTFVNPAAWLGVEVPASDPEAIGAILERHLAAFPGATMGELARWWGVQPGGLRVPVARLGDRLTMVGLEGAKAYVRTADLYALASAEPGTTVRLLGGFDPYTLSIQKEAEPLLPLARRPLVSRQAGWISAVLLVGGRVAGTWTHDLGPKRTRIELAPWRRLAKTELRAIDAEADRVGAFLAPASPVELVVADPA